MIRRCCMVSGVVLLLLVFGAWAQDGTVKIAISDLSVKPGTEDVTLPIKLDNPGTVVRAVQLVLNYNPELIKIKGVKPTDRTEELSVFSDNIPEPGEFRLAIMDLGEKVVKKGNGTIAKILLDVSSEASPGATDVLSLLVSGETNTAAFGPDGKLYDLVVEKASVDMFDIVTAVEESKEAIPTEYALNQNYPNPFNPATNIRYQLVEDGHVTLKIYNALGQLVRTLVDGEKGAGYYSITWDATDNKDVEVAGGVYFYRIYTEKGFNASKKMVLLK